MMQNESVNRRQFVAVAFCALLSPSIRVIPTLIVPISGEHAWISVAVSILPLAMLALMLQSFQRSLRAGEGMPELFIRILGKTLGKGMLLIFALWMLFYCAFVLRVSAHRFISTIFPASSPLAYIPAMGVLLLMSALSQFKVLSRLSGIIRPLLTAVLVLVLILSLPEIHPYTYSVPAATDIPDIALGTVPVINALSIWAYLSFLEGYVADGAPKAKHFLPSLILTVVLLTGLCYATVGTFGPVLTDKINNPFFVMIRSIKVMGALERIEALVIALWFFTDFILAGAMMHAAVSALKCVLGIKIISPGFSPGDGRWLPWLCSSLSIGCALTVAKTSTEMTDLSMFIIPGLNMFFIFVLFPLVFLIGLIRRRV